MRQRKALQGIDLTQNPAHTGMGLHCCRKVVRRDPPHAPPPVGASYEREDSRVLQYRGPKATHGLLDARHEFDIDDALIAGAAFDVLHNAVSVEELGGAVKVTPRQRAGLVTNRISWLSARSLVMKAPHRTSPWRSSFHCRANGGRTQLVRHGTVSSIAPRNAIWWRQRVIA